MAAGDGQPGRKQDRAAAGPPHDPVAAGDPCRATAGPGARVWQPGGAVRQAGSAAAPADRAGRGRGPAGARPDGDLPRQPPARQVAPHPQGGQPHREAVAGSLARRAAVPNRGRGRRVSAWQRDHRGASGGAVAGATAADSAGPPCEPAGRPLPAGLPGGLHPPAGGMGGAGRQRRGALRHHLRSDEEALLPARLLADPKDHPTRPAGAAPAAGVGGGPERRPPGLLGAG